MSITHKRIQDSYVNGVEGSSGNSGIAPAIAVSIVPKYDVLDQDNDLTIKYLQM